MQGRGGGRDPFSNFGSPFGGFGSPGNLMSSFFGGRDPFDDPFFTRPFGGMFESNFFGPNGNPFPNMHPPAFFEHPSAFPAQAPEFLEHQPPEPKRSKGPIIEELDSDEEEVEEKKDNPRKHGRSSNGGPHIQYPDNRAEEQRSKQMQRRNDYSHYNIAQQQPQTHSFTFSSSSVTYGGSGGAYYTSSKMRRTGSDGLTYEESREADSSTRQATHKVSKGLYNKGHSVTRKLASDGKVDTMQTLHNLNEDELSGFNEAWNGSARNHMPGSTGNFIGHNNMGAGSSGQIEQVNQGRRALPSTEQLQKRHGSTRMQQTGRKKN